MIRPLRLNQEALDRAAADLDQRLPWGSSGRDLILGHLAAVEADERIAREQLAQQLAENSRLRLELADARSTPFDD